MCGPLSGTLPVVSIVVPVLVNHFFMVGILYYKFG